MSLKQVYTSDIVAYDPKPDDLSETDLIFWDGFFGGGDKEFVEKIWWISGIVVFHDTVKNKRLIHLLIVLQTGAWPGSAFKRYSYDFLTGTLVETEDLTDTFHDYLSVDRLNQSKDGTVWSLDNSLNIIKRDPRTLEPTDTVYTSAYLNEGTNQNIRGFTLDPVGDRAILATWNRPNDEVTVRTLSDPSVIHHRVRVAGIVSEIFPEAGNRIYVLSDSGLITLVDYEIGEPLGVFRVQIDEPTGSTSSVNVIKSAWDRFLHRVLIASYTADEENGEATTRVKGYFPRPLPVGITPPLPLIKPVAGRRVPVLGHAYGDAGEPIAGKQVEFSFTGPITSKVTKKGTDGFGDVVFPTTATASGSVDADFLVEETS